MCAYVQFFFARLSWLWCMCHTIGGRMLFILMYIPSVNIAYISHNLPVWLSMVIRVTVWAISLPVGANLIEVFPQIIIKSYESIDHECCSVILSGSRLVFEHGGLQVQSPRRIFWKQGLPINKILHTAIIVTSQVRWWYLLGYISAWTLFSLLVKWI